MQSRYKGVTLSEIKKWIKRNKITTNLEYREKCPERFPTNLDAYKPFEKQWKGWKDILYPKEELFVSYNVAKRIIRKLKIKDQKQYKKYYKKHGKLPSTPNHTYKDEWKSWGDFTGSGFVRSRIWIDYDSAKKIIKKMKINTKIEFEELKKQKNKKLEKIPVDARGVYREVWKGWGDFLGTGRTRLSDYVSLQKAKSIVKKMGIKTSSEFRKLKKQKHPMLARIPSSPEKVYR